MAGSIQFLDITVDDGQPKEGISCILNAVKPHWDLTQVSQRPLSGGYINKIYCCHLKEDKDQNDALIVRIHCGSMDKTKEFLSIQVAQAAGCNAPLYASFNNGLVYKYVSGHMPSLHDFEKPEVIREVTRGMFRLHQTDITSLDLFDRKGNRAYYDKTVDNFDRMKEVAAAIPSKPDNPDLDEAFQRYRADFPDDVINREMEFAISLMRQAKIPLCFIHGDIHKNNMVLDSAGHAVFIDFETSSIGYRYFDLGYFFVMWRVSHFSGWVEPGEPVLTPEVRRQYIEAYLQAKCEHEGRNRKDVSPEEWELLDLQHQVIEFVSILEYTIEPFVFVNYPGMPPEFLNLHPEAKNIYFKQKATIREVIASIEELDKVVNGPWYSETQWNVDRYFDMCIR